MRTIGGKSGKPQYTLKTVLGQGSFGKVYHSPPYAIKEITINLQRHTLTDILKEASILQDLDHPYIVKLYDIIEENNSLFMIMEYCEMDLAQYLKKYKLDEQRAIEIIKQVMSAMSYLVNKEIIHRDIKPANILVNSKNEFKLADFGLARYVKEEYDSSLLQTVAGTPLYMAPQILKKYQYTTKCDIWSAGIIFFELLTGRLPWTANNENELYNNITTKSLDIPSNLSEWARKLLISMLVVNENERIGWDDLFNMVRQYTPKNRSRSRERPASAAKSQTNFAERSPIKVAKECLTYPSGKLRELLALDLEQFFQEATIIKLLKTNQYRPTADEMTKIKEVLSYYNEQLKAWYLQDVPNLRKTQ